MTNRSNFSAVAKVNGITITSTFQDGIEYIPIKPICEALGVNYTTQIEKIKKDEFLNSTIPLRGTVAADNKERRMISLPYRYIFGWLFTINPANVKDSAKAAVMKYRVECYDVLYDHFTRQSKFLKEKQAVIEEHLKTVDNLKSNFKDAKTKLAEAEKELKKAREMNFENWKQAEFDFSAQDN